MSRALCVILDILLVHMASAWQPKPHPAGYVCQKTPQRPPMEGKLDGVWELAAWTDEFVDIEGPSKPKPHHSTRVKMLWDEDHLYIGAWLDEPYPWATLTLHDSVVYKDNDFEVFIDPDGDNHQYFEWEINALGTIWDLFMVKPYRDGGPAIHSFESIASSEPTQADGPTGWHSMTRGVYVDGSLNNGSALSNGWGVTMAFPWSVLIQAGETKPNVPPLSGDQWRINFSRVQWNLRWDEATSAYVKDPPDQHENNWVFSPQWAIAMHQPETWGYLQFSSSLVGTPAEAMAQDNTWPLRSFLMEAYYRQKNHWGEAGVYADTWEGLGLEPSDSIANRLLVQTTEASFIVTGQLQLPSCSGSQNPLKSEQQWLRLYVNEEGKITKRIIT